jgi:hypothetical protein
MSFGWSAGDIVSAINTLMTVGKALRESGGSASEFQHATSFVTGVSKTITAIQTVMQTNPNLEWQTELSDQAENLKTVVKDFKKKVEKYELSLGE